MPLIAIYVTWKQLGFYILLYLAALQNVSKDLYEAASIDGGSAQQQFFRITVPMMRPVILFTAVLSTIGTFKIFNEPYVLTGGGPLNSSLTVLLYLYNQGFQAFKLGYAAALAYQGEHQRAVAEAAAATGKGAPAGNLLYDAARVYAVCSRAAGKDAALPQARRDELSEQYAARSVEMLGKAAAAGFFEAPERVDKLKKDEAFVPLRSRGDFGKLLRELDGAVREGP